LADSCISKLENSLDSLLGGIVALQAGKTNKHQYKKKQTNKHKLNKKTNK